MPVTKAKAEKVREAVIKRYGLTPAEAEEVILRAPGEGFSDSSGWEIIWEAGPYEWSYNTHRFQVPGTFLEPYNTFVLDIYPED